MTSLFAIATFQHIYLPSTLWERLALFAVGLIIFLVSYLYATYGRFDKIPGIPHFEGYPIVGVAVNTRPDAHEVRLKMIEEKGPVSQFQFFGQHFVLINDGKVAKIAMENIKNKGFLQVGL